MQHYVGLDLSVKETSVCIVDKAGKVIREVKVATKPAEILAVLTEEALAIERIGLEIDALDFIPRIMQDHAALKRDSGQMRRQQCKVVWRQCR